MTNKHTNGLKGTGERAKASQRQATIQMKTNSKEDFMPPPYVKTIKEEILYEYAKLISRSAYGTLQRGFITERFQKLRDGEITIPGAMR